MLMESKKLELKKHVAFIHCSNHLTLLQRKISNVLLYKAYDELMTRDAHVITMGELIKLIGYTSNDYALIKSAIKVLISTVLEWNLLNDDYLHNEAKGERGGEGRSWHASSILASARIEGAICTYTYSPELKNLLYMPEMYGKINLLVQSRFKSVYALVLYENCVRYKNLNNTRWFPLDLFRKLMGISDGKYLVYRDMKRKVVDKAISEINAFSELTIAAEIRRDNQKVIAIRFTIKQKEGAVALQPKPFAIQDVDKKIDDDLTSKLVSVFNISPTHARKIINDFGYDFVAGKANLLEQCLKISGKNIKNISGYFIRALHNEQQLNEAKIIVEKETKQKAEKDAAIKHLKCEYEKYLDGKIMEKYFSVIKKEQEMIAKKFEVFLGDGIFLSSYRKQGLENILVRDEFIKYIKHNCSYFYESFLSFDDFCIKEKEVISTD